MSQEETPRRADVFVDGQNLFYAAKKAFGYPYLNADILKLSHAVCTRCGWDLGRTHFYTGVPDAADNALWHQFWSAKLGAMGHQGVKVFSRSLRYRNRTVEVDGKPYTFLVGQEKGVDVRLALDVVRAVYRRECDVVLIFSQDQDLSEVAEEVRTIAREQQRWVKIASAFPFSPASDNRRGIDKTDWIRVERALYDACLDERDFRPKTR